MIIRAPADWNGPDWQTQLEALCDKSLLAPFDPIALSFADRLSKRILLDKRMRSYPEMMALAHWLRKGNQAELIHSFEQRHQGSLLRPRGVVLHFAPANVDTIFVYSFMISLLCGNSSIVRVSSTPNEQIDLLIGLLNELLEEEAFIPLKERICILTYAHNDAITSKLSQLCAVRVIWGRR
ncbi:acyl-CoA reductase [Cohnella rhizosphaerae]|uniref:Uncharacterized protein n=1 Tax=Cohnella rhizosphaerae TaxID=1457232 RepID=A0A9X4L1M4_9BACL|nr:acyl-CoA reductase [Cohnella rhizosphaerae]MDG0811882.1 hypothetical protein [Cohnella rhizosphaerae]